MSELIEATPNPKDEIEECRIYIVRKKDQTVWMEKAKSGDEDSKLCLWAASNFMKAIPNEPSGCCCCDVLFSSADVPHAFIVLIPTKRDPEKVRAHAKAVCPECSKHDDKWLVDQGVHREGLAPTPARPGDKVH